MVMPDPQYGHYWYTRMEDGQWGVFWTHPLYKGWHYKVAEFHNEDRAELFVDIENVDLSLESQPEVAKIEPPKLLAPPPPRQGRVPSLAPKHLSETYDALVARLPEIFTEYPKGVSSGYVMKEFNLGYADATALLRGLDQAGLARWIHTQGIGGGKVLCPPGTPENDSDLSHKQGLLLDAMSEIADGRGCVSGSYAELARRAGVKINSINSMLYALETKGYIMMAKPASLNGSSSAIYQILQKNTERQDIAAE